MLGVYADREKEGATMRHTISFDLPDEKEEFDCALMGSHYYRVLCEYDEILRKKVKHSSDPEDAWANMARKVFLDIMRYNGVEL
jgi:hypothetical protein